MYGRVARVKQAEKGKGSDMHANRASRQAGRHAPVVLAALGGSRFHVGTLCKIAQ